MIKLKAIRHTGVPVTDVKKAKRFYGDVLGLKEIPRPNIPGIPGMWYEWKGVQVHIIGQRDAKKGKRLPAVGSHIAIQVEDLEAAKKELKRRRVKFQELTPPPSMRAKPVLFLKDPDGNVVELRSEA
jgi:catechol 2,3-dioxygenase-like lactoylglutathione lyase family enzyme